MDSEKSERSGTAAERTAAELSLRRLIDEQFETEIKLKNELLNLELLRRQEKILKNGHSELDADKLEMKGFRNQSIWLSAILFVFVAFGWSWLLIVIVLLLMLAAILQVKIKSARKLNLPIIPVPACSDDQLNLTSRLEAINSEIESHRLFLESSSPVYHQRREIF